MGIRPVDKLQEKGGVYLVNHEREGAGKAQSLCGQQGVDGARAVGAVARAGGLPWALGNWRVVRNPVF